MMEDINHYLHTGTSKSAFGLLTDHLLPELENIEQDRVSTSFSKLNAYSAYNFYNSSIWSKTATLHEPW